MLGPVNAFDPRNAVKPHERTFANQISEGLRLGKYMLIDKPSVNPITFANASQSCAIASASQGQVDTIICPGAFGHQAIEMFQTTAQTKNPAVIAGKGYEIGLDLVNNESVEYVPGGNDVNNPFGYQAYNTSTGAPGSAAVLLRVTLEIADVSGSDQLVVGWRKQESYAVPTSFLAAGDALYTDFIGIGFSGSADPNNIKVISDVNNSGSTTVFDTTLAFADTKIHRLEVWLRKRKAFFFINGVALGQTVRKDGTGAAFTPAATLAPPAYTVGSGLFMVPMIFSRYDVTTPGTIIMRRLEVAQLLEVGLDDDAKGPQSLGALS